MALTNGSNGPSRLHTPRDLGDAHHCSIGQAKAISAENTNALAQTFTRVLEFHIPPLQRALATSAQAHNALLARIEYLESRTLRGRWIRCRLWVLNRATSYVARRQHGECALLVGGPLNARLLLASRLTALSPTSPVHRLTMPKGYTGPPVLYQPADQTDRGGRRCFVFVGFEATPVNETNETPVDAPVDASPDIPARAD